MDVGPTAVDVDNARRRSANSQRCRQFEEPYVTIIQQRLNYVAGWNHQADRTNIHRRRDHRVHSYLRPTAENYCFNHIVLACTAP